MRLDRVAAKVVRAVVPFAPTLRRVKRLVVPAREDPGNLDFAVTQGLEMLSALRDAGVRVEGADVLEFGTGWSPVVPLLFRVAGARRNVLTDIERLMDARTTEEAAGAVERRIGDVAAALGLAPAEAAARLRGDPPFRPEYLVPWDPARHPAGDVDLVVSRAVLEHVPEPQIRAFLGAFHRVLRPGGAMCHMVDLSDHWQHRDRSLSRVSFLQYEEDDWRWRLAQVNQQGYQNRLRHSDYRRLLREAGFEEVAARAELDARCLEDLRTLPLASRFRGRDPEDLAVITSLLVSRRGG